MKIKPKQLKDKDVPFVRKKILQKQKGLCPICGKKITDPCLDHHHKKRIKGTGCVRGVLCRSCNVFIAKSENSALRFKIQHKDLPKILRNMANYLEKKQYPYLHPSEKPKRKILKKASYNKLKKVYKGKAKFPEYKVDKKKKNNQTLTKPLKKLFDEYKIKPEFYSK